MAEENKRELKLLSNSPATMAYIKSQMRELREKRGATLKAYKRKNLSLEAKPKSDGISNNTSDGCKQVLSKSSRVNECGDITNSVESQDAARGVSSKKLQIQSTRKLFLPSDETGGQNRVLSFYKSSFKSPEPMTERCLSLLQTSETNPIQRHRRSSNVQTNAKGIGLEKERADCRHLYYQQPGVKNKHHNDRSRIPSQVSTKAATHMPSSKGATTASGITHQMTTIRQMPSEQDTHVYQNGSMKSSEEPMQKVQNTLIYQNCPVQPATESMRNAQITHVYQNGSVQPTAEQRQKPQNTNIYQNDSVKPTAVPRQKAQFTNIYQNDYVKPTAEPMRKAQNTNIYQNGSVKPTAEPMYKAQNTNIYQNDSVKPTAEPMRKAQNTNIYQNGSMKPAAEPMHKTQNSHIYQNGQMKSETHNTGHMSMAGLPNQNVAKKESKLCSFQRIPGAIVDTEKSDIDGKIHAIKPSSHDRQTNLIQEAWSAVSTISPASATETQRVIIEQKTKCVVTSTPQGKGANQRADVQSTALLAKHHETSNRPHPSLANHHETSNRPRSDYSLYQPKAAVIDDGGRCEFQIIDSIRDIPLRKIDNKGYPLHNINNNGLPLLQIDNTGLHLHQINKNGLPLQQIDNTGLHLHQIDKNGLHLHTIDSNVDGEARHPNKATVASERSPLTDDVDDSQRFHKHAEIRAKSVATRRPPVVPKTKIASAPNESKIQRLARRGATWLRPTNLFPEAKADNRSHNRKKNVDCDKKHSEVGGLCETDIVPQRPIPRALNACKANGVQARPSVQKHQPGDTRQDRIPIPSNIVDGYRVCERSNSSGPVVIGDFRSTDISQKVPGWKAEGEHSINLRRDSRMTASSAKIESIYCRRSSCLPTKNATNGKHKNRVTLTTNDGERRKIPPKPLPTRKSVDIHQVHSESGQMRLTATKLSGDHRRRTMPSQTNRIPDSIPKENDRPEKVQRVRHIHVQPINKTTVLSEHDVTRTPLNDLNKGSKEDRREKNAQNKNALGDTRVEEEFQSDHTFIQQMERQNAPQSHYQNIALKKRQSLNVVCNQAQPSLTSLVPKRQSLPTGQEVNHDNQSLPPSQGTNRDNQSLPPSQGTNRDNQSIPPSQGTNRDNQSLPSGQDLNRSHHTSGIAHPAKSRMRQLKARRELERLVPVNERNQSPDGRTNVNQNNNITETCDNNITIGIDYKENENPDLAKRSDGNEMSTERTDREEPGTFSKEMTKEGLSGLSKTLDPSSHSASKSTTGGGDQSHEPLAEEDSQRLYANTDEIHAKMDSQKTAKTHDQSPNSTETSSSGYVSLDRERSNKITNDRRVDVTTDENNGSALISVEAVDERKEIVLPPCESRLQEDPKSSDKPSPHSLRKYSLKPLTVTVYETISRSSAKRANDSEGKVNSLNIITNTNNINNSNDNNNDNQMLSGQGQSSDAQFPGLPNPEALPETLTNVHQSKVSLQNGHDTPPNACSTERDPNTPILQGNELFPPEMSRNTNDTTQAKLLPLRKSIDRRSTVVGHDECKSHSDTDASKVPDRPGHRRRVQTIATGVDLVLTDAAGRERRVTDIGGPSKHVSDGPRESSVPPDQAKVRRNRGATTEPSARDNCRLPVGTMQTHTDSSGSSGLLASQEKVRGHQQAMPQMPGTSGQHVRHDDPIKSYDSFFQELERDFSQPHPYHTPRGQNEGQRSSWNDFSSQNHYTSTLEHKHGSSTLSSSDRGGNKARKDIADRKPQTRTSLSPNSVCSSLRSDSQYSSCYSGNNRKQDAFSHPKASNNNNNNKYQTDECPPTEHNHTHNNPSHHRNVNLYRVNEISPSSSAALPLPLSNPNTNPSFTGMPSNNNHYEPFQSKSSGSFDNNGTISSHTSSNEGRKANEQVAKSMNNNKQSQSHIHRHSHNNHHHNNHHHHHHNHTTNSNAPNSQMPSSSSYHQSTPPRSQTIPNAADFYDKVGDRGVGGKRYSQGTSSGNSNSREMDLQNVPESMLNGLPGEERMAMRDGNTNDGGHSGSSRLSQQWPESTYSFSDNEKQLLEEMRRMKKEHQNVLRTYEGRINKLMDKMHELRNIAEMLEHSSNKSSPFAALPAKIALLKILGEGQSEKSPKQGDGHPGSHHAPPPLPPRPGRGSKVYPNKPIISPAVDMKHLPWSRVILDGSSSTSIIWQGMSEPDLDKEELERNFSGIDEVPPHLNLYDDICKRRGEVKTETISIYDSDRSQRINSELRNLNCTIRDITRAFVMLNPGDLYIDSFAELLELLASHRDLDKISSHVKRKGQDHLDAPEYLVVELSKVDNFRERLELLRFKNKLQINLFEIDQQLRELHIACNEITSSLSLKNVLETILAIGNYMNGGTDKGQADGFRLEIINSLKYIQDKTRKGNLLEFVMKIYCLRFESDLTHGCPTHFRLPEPSNMRHAAQVSFEDIQRALKELKDELSYVMNKLENLSRKQGNLNQALKVTSENFMTSAVEVLAEEQKLLDDTRLQFRKTVLFFNENEESSTPNSFFQLWASFLHDCKYYWKLAHRNLARAKFTEELATKSQLSCSSLPGYNNLKSVMMKHVASLQHEDEMDASKVEQLQHISSWIESVGRYTLDLKPNQGSPQKPSQSSHDKPCSEIAIPRRDQNSQSGHQKKNPEPIPQYANSAIYLQDSEYGSRSDYNHFGGDPDLNRERDSNDNYKHYDPESFIPSSPKPIKAIPPNVIKPLPLNHISPTISSPSPSSPHIHMGKPVSLVQAQPSMFTAPSAMPGDDFGFMDVNTASLVSPDSQAEFHQDHRQSAEYPRPLESQGAMSPNGEYAKKNPFFKNLLKKDTKKSPQGAQEDGSQQSSSKGVTAPLNKLKNTFVQKLSGSGNSRKSKDVKSSRSRDNNALSPPTNLQVYIPESYENGFKDDGEYPTSPDDQNEISQVLRSSKGQGKISSPDYQNFHPSQPRRPEQQEFTSFQPLHARDEIESLPSTISSVRSGNDPSRYSSRPFGNREANTAIEDSKSDEMSKSSEITNASSGMKPSFPRLRSAIALGSNISISDVFDRVSDSTLIEDQPENYPDHAEITRPSYESVSNANSNNNNNNNNNNNANVSKNNNNNNYPRSMVAAVPTSSDQKVVRANAVPVYKAKLIPNYENQTKLDPRMDVGIRGKAEAVHVPQMSKASESYKQELQKKSEQYVAGGAYHAYGPNQSRGFSSNKILGAPTSYTVMPPKPSRYHASPIHVSPFGGYQFSSPNINGESPKDRSHGNTDQTSSLQHHSKSVTEVTPPNLRSEKNRRDDKGKIPFGGSNTVPIPGRRSSSAHNLIERESRSANYDANRRPDNFAVDSGHFKGSQGHLSRRDLSDKKTTPTSRRVQSQGRHKGSPVAINSLIDKFEKRPHSEQANSAGLLDINDKPPSMTSTPVTKRKIGSTPPSTSQSNHGKSLTPASDTGSQNSHPRQGEDTRQKHGNGSSSIKNLSEHFAKFESPSQLVTPFNVQTQNSPSNSREITQQNYMPGNEEHDLRSMHLEHTQNAYMHEDGSGHRMPDGPERENRQKVNSRTHGQQAVLSSDILMPKKRSSDHIRSDHSHSFNARRAGQGSATDSNGHRNRHSTPSSTCSSQQSSSYQSPYIPKPEPQYPSNSRGQHQRGQQSPSTSTNFVSSPTKPSSFNFARNHPEGQYPNYHQSQSQSHPQLMEPENHLPSHQNHQNPHNYHSWSSSSSAKTNPSGSGLNVEGKDDIDNLTQQMGNAYKSSSSAFNHPAKSTRSQPGHKSAMAVVKPTVMHL